MEKNNKDRFVEVLLIGKHDIGKEKIVAFSSSLCISDTISKSLKLFRYILENLDYEKLEFNLVLDKVSKDLGVSRTTVHYWLKDLIENEIIEKISTNLYKLKAYSTILGIPIDREEKSDYVLKIFQIPKYEENAELFLLKKLAGEHDYFLIPKQDIVVILSVLIASKLLNKELFKISNEPENIFDKNEIVEKLLGDLLTKEEKDIGNLHKNIFKFTHSFFSKEENIKKGGM